MDKYELIINKSRFIALRYELSSLDEVADILSALKKEYKKATHICYAYVYNRDQVSEKCSDDGEPGGTAGYPILNVIKKKNLTNTMVVVVRFFGGIKLGAGGLTRAYTKACAGVLN
ncbi:MAG: YigZ family protein [Clostridiales bacterium]|nr:YigZ family protein [Clostridiales bacterium]